MRRLPCPQWCAPDLCTADVPPAGTHRSGPFALQTPEGTATASLWALPASNDNPAPSVFVTLLGDRAPVDLALERHPDRRRERRLVRAHLRTALSALTVESRRAAA
jgi:hypothetical protein